MELARSLDDVAYIASKGLEGGASRVTVTTVVDIVRK